MKNKLVLTIALTSIFAPLASRAEEGVSGHYLPGATASFIDALPGRESRECGSTASTNSGR
ncbi:MAG: hypothetical protein ABI651_21785 [Verrucomicrobiota bacterium]